MTSGRRVGKGPDCHTFLRKFWHFQMAVSQWKLARLTPNLGILWILGILWLCESIVANPIINRLVPGPSRFTITNCQIVRSRSLTHGINYKFMCLCAYFHLELTNERARICAVIDLIKANQGLIQACRRLQCSNIGVWAPENFKMAADILLLVLKDTNY